MPFDASLTNDRDKIRFLVGDTDDTDEMLEDETYDGILSTASNLGMAASVAARAIAAKFARETDYRASRVGESRSQLYRHYLSLASQLARTPDPFARTRALPRILVGGASAADDAVLDADGDLTPAQFDVGMFDHPEAGGGDDGGE